MTTLKLYTRMKALDLKTIDYFMSTLRVFKEVPTHPVYSNLMIFISLIFVLLGRPIGFAQWLFIKTV